jgi:hypothetical protein
VLLKTYIRFNVPLFLFFIKDILLYNIIIKGYNRLYILNIILKDIFNKAYKGEHFRILKTIKELKGLCILKLIRKIKDYIKYYLSYLINLTLYI